MDLISKEVVRKGYTVDAHYDRLLIVSKPGVPAQGTTYKPSITVTYTIKAPSMTVIGLGELENTIDNVIKL